MREKLNNIGYKVVAKTSNFEIFNNDELEQLIILMPKFDYEANYLDEIITIIKGFRYQKKTMAFIKEIKNEIREEVIRDESYYMKIEGYRKELIPTKTNKSIKFEAVDSQPEECLFYDPYLNTTTNIINLLNEINNGVENKIVYKYPKVMGLSYIKYFLLKKVNIEID